MPGMDKAQSGTLMTWFEAVVIFGVIGSKFPFCQELGPGDHDSCPLLRKPWVFEPPISNHKLCRSIITPH